ncbi:MAG: transcriptional regulator, family [Microbacteriaceae bacterium]|jgi:transcriptional regulator with XRE-family HTH domain|nr:transcriptional regulator, family [Microbacteriaceae bacterium]
MPEQTTTTGASLRVLRKIAGMTLEEVAAEADTSIAYLSKVETGKLAPTKGYVAQVTLALAMRMRSAA